MTKRLTFMDYMYSLLFIFLLVCVVGAFFYGVQVGKSKSAEKYEELLTVELANEHQLEDYHQQYLVSFYHTVFLPYREFQRFWFDTVESIELHKNTRSGTSLMEEVSEFANQKYEEIQQASLPQSSTLLVDAQVNLLQSLKLFSSAADQTDLSGTGLELLRNIESSTYYNEAKSFGLQGIEKYYRSITIWNESVEDLPESDYLEQDELSVAEWEKLNLNQKNEYVANWIVQKEYYTDFYIHDLTLRIDEFIVSGQYEKLDLETIPKIAETLIDTKAVRYGDFITSKSKFYLDETLPQLPFFFAQP